jgi:hypothetical protein
MSSSHSALSTFFYFQIMLTIVRVQEHGIKGELGSNSLADIEEIKHLFNGLVSLLSHTSIRNKFKYRRFNFLTISLSNFIKERKV